METWMYDYEHLNSSECGEEVERLRKQNVKLSLRVVKARHMLVRNFLQDQISHNETMILYLNGQTIMHSS